MVHYIRFLRVPQIKLDGNGVKQISAVLTVTTDLGEAYYPEDLELIVRLVNTEHPEQTSEKWRLTWRKSSQVAKLNVRYRSHAASPSNRLHVSTRETDHCLLNSFELPKVLDVWSSVFTLDKDCSATDYVERKLWLSRSTSINIFEATRESIARHIWDGALGCLELYKHTLLLQDVITMMPLFHQLLIGNARQGIKVVELGSGCGVAGIALAQIVPGSKVLLTDLEAAQEIIAMNINNASLPKGSSLSQEVLDWEATLTVSERHTDVDLLIVCECIYNADSCPILIRMLQQFITLSPEVKILVVTKRRHDSEAVFFGLMEEAMLQLLEQCFTVLPHQNSEADIEQPQAEIYLYAAAEVSISQNESAKVLPIKTEDDSPRPQKRLRAAKHQESG